MKTKTKIKLNVEEMAFEVDDASVIDAEGNARDDCCES
jgi:hypothetical protein